MDSYVIYHKKSFTLLESPGRGQRSFPSERVAKTILTKSVNTNHVANRDDWVIATYQQWEAADPDVIVYSVFDLNNEHPITIKKSQRGSRASDPSMEGYHTL